MFHFFKAFAVLGFVTSVAYGGISAWLTAKYEDHMFGKWSIILDGNSQGWGHVLNSALHPSLTTLLLSLLLFVASDIAQSLRRPRGE